MTFRVVPAATPESDGEWFEFTPDGVCYAHYPESSTPLKVVKWLERMVETEDYVG